MLLITNNLIFDRNSGFSEILSITSGTLDFGSPYRESTTYGFLCLLPRHGSPPVPVSAVDSFLSHGKSAGKIFLLRLSVACRSGGNEPKIPSR